MTANELRNGNLVNPKINGIALKEEIHVVEPTTLMMMLNIVDNKGISFEPIPLTEDLLLRFGAKKLRENQYKIGDRLLILRENVWTDYGSGVQLHYVHTFQNFIFALTQKELVLK